MSIINLLTYAWTATVEFFVNTVRGLFKIGYCHSGPNLTGKTAIVTGCNVGIGKEVSLELAKRGAKVIMACRNMNTGQEALNHIKSIVPDAQLQLENLDVSSGESISLFVKRIEETEPKIDILVNNAGIFAQSRQTSSEGREITFSTNYLGPFRLTLALLEKLKRASNARVVNVSSIAHLLTDRIEFEDPNFNEKPYPPLQSYGQSKLALSLFSKELSRRLKETNITVYDVHPGFVSSELYREMGTCDCAILSSIMKVISGALKSLFAQTPAQGAQTVVYCAVSENCALESGLYYADCKPKSCSEQAKDEVLARKLWEKTCEWLNMPTFKEKKQL